MLEHANKNSIVFYASMRKFSTHFFKRNYIFLTLFSIGFSSVATGFFNIKHFVEILQPCDLWLMDPFIYVINNIGT